MKFRWSPFGSKKVYTLSNPKRVLTSIPIRNKTLLEIAPFDTEDAEKLCFAGVVKEMDIEQQTDEKSILFVAKTDNYNYRACLKKAIDECETGEFEKLVVSRKVELKGLLNHIVVFNDLVLNNPNCFVYCFEFDDLILMGATPERLLKIKDRECLSASLAGTMSSDSGMSILNWGKKELKEQKYVTDYLYSIYSKYCSEVSTSGLTTKQNGPVCHLLTEVTGLLKTDSDQSSILEDIHPSPAVCGLPKNEARYWLKNNEGYNREYYSGYIGIVNESESDYYVNLRCLKSDNDNTILYVGGGITKDSKMDLEEKETEQKLGVLLNSIKKSHTFVNE